MIATIWSEVRVGYGFPVVLTGVGRFELEGLKVVIKIKGFN